MRKTLSKSEKDELNAALAPFGFELAKKDVAIIQDERFLFVDGALAFFFAPAPVRWIPALHLLLTRPLLPLLVVDMGAVRFVANGADVMRPGIREIPQGLAPGALVCVVDERNRKPLAVGEMLLASADAQAAAGGKVVKTLHYVGDEIWKVQGI